MPFVSLGMSVVATCADSLLTALVDESEQVLPCLSEPPTPSSSGPRSRHLHLDQLSRPHLLPSFRRISPPELRIPVADTSRSRRLTACNFPNDRVAGRRESHQETQNGVEKRVRVPKTRSSCDSNCDKKTSNEHLIFYYLPIMNKTKTNLINAIRLFG